MRNLVIRENSNFENVIALVDKTFIEAKSKKGKVNFSNLLEGVFYKNKNNSSFKIFDSIFEFKAKVLKYYNQRKRIRKKSKQKIPPGIRSWEKFWENF